MERLAEEDPEVGRTRGRCFRGWWVLTGCVLIRLASAPGHSFGIVAFIDSFIDSLHVSRFDVSFAWLIASCASTVLTPLAGAGLDQFGVRSFCWTIAPLLLLSVYGLSLVANASELALCLSAIRFLGPECLSLASGATYQRWFVRTRGRAAALFGLNGLVLMSLPALFTFLIEGLGWRSAAQTLAFLLTSMLLLGTSMVHDTPQAVGLQADGDSPGSSGPLEAAEEMEEKEMEHLDEKVKEMDETEMEEKEMEHLDEKVMDEDTEVDTSSCHSGSSVSSSFASGGDCSCSARGSNSGTTIVDTVTAMDGESSDGTKREATSSSGGDGGGDKLQGMSSSHAPLAVSTLREAARYPLLWCFCLLDTCFCLFWAGFNLTALDVISSQRCVQHLSPCPDTRFCECFFTPHVISSCCPCTHAHTHSRTHAHTHTRTHAHTHGELPNHLPAWLES